MIDVEDIWDRIRPGDFVLIVDQWGRATWTRVTFVFLSKPMIQVSICGLLFNRDYVIDWCEL